MERKLLSACMIMKNEERNLPRCLNSIRGLVDEIVIVDTGSEDKSVEIAESFGARVFHHPWEYDFSKHRNQSMDYAEGEWCFIVDADEELFMQPQIDATKIRNFLESIKDPNCEAIAIPLDDVQKGNVVMNFNTARIFKQKGVRYEGIIHNQPIIKNEGILCAMMYLKHYGYDLTPEQMQQKEERTVGMLMKRLEINPQDYACFFYLSQVYATKGDRERSAYWAERYLTTKNDKDFFSTSIYFTQIHNYMQLGRKAETRMWLNLALQELPRCLDIALSQVEMGTWLGDVKLLMNGGRRFLDIYQEWNRDPGKKGNRFTFSHNSKALSYVLYQMIMSEITDSLQLLQIFQEVIQSTPHDYMNGMVGALKSDLAKFGFNLNVEMDEETKKQKISL